MRLLLVRHADALPGEPDATRALSPEGREAARQLGARLHREGVHPTAILTSPLLRARETGDALAVALGCASEPHDALAPGATAAGVRTAVAGRGETVIVIGHQPDCGRIAAELGDGTEPAFPPAGMAELQLDR
ncbi:MAG TPA: histidine phosphatase family protein [Gaiellaceae bacterium]|jgi:phosphohistidine phosphatase|nr:histidine phosphatase family protein [Gaiellaceae bacterium]